MGDFEKGWWVMLMAFFLGLTIYGCELIFEHRMTDVDKLMMKQCLIQGYEWDRGCEEPHSGFHVKL